MRFLPCGDAALLVELDDLDAVLGLHAGLQDRSLPGIVDLVPATRTLLVRFDPSLVSGRTLVRELGVLVGTATARTATSASESVEIAVTYDGQDLTEVGALTGLGPRGVVEAHTAQRWRVAFAGFAPGFAYLVGEDDRLQVPRRAQPRSTVPAGAVGLADTFSGVYPRSSPGGWQLIGRTRAAVWDADRDPPALLRPGTWVRFVEAG